MGGNGFRTTGVHATDYGRSLHGVVGPQLLTTVIKAPKVSDQALALRLQLMDFKNSHWDPCDLGLWGSGWAAGRGLDLVGSLFSNFPTHSSGQRRRDA